MAKGFSHSFYTSLEVRDDWLPPSIFPLIEFIFKTVQWASLAAILKYGAVKAGNKNIEYFAGILIALLGLVVAERVTRSILGRIHPDSEAHWASILLTLFATTALSIWAASHAVQALQALIGEFITIYSNAANAKCTN